MIENRKKIIILGIDGATFDLIEPWVHSGKLTALKSLMENGAWGNLQSTNPPLTPCAWSSMMTGKNPGKHGMYDFYSLDRSFRLNINFADSRKGKDLWTILSEKGYKCIVSRVPFTFPPRKINGIMISDFTTPDLKSNFTYPKEFKKELLREFPDYQISEKVRYSENENDKKKFLEEIVKMTRLQTKVAKWLLKTKEWDFFMHVFMGVDHVQHYYWKYMDKSHPGFNIQESKEYQDAILEVYQEVDNAIAELLTSVPKNTVVILVSDHGAGPYFKNVYLNNWLRKKGYLYLKKNASVLLKRSLNFCNINPESLIKIISRLKPNRVNKKISLKDKKGLAEKVFSKISCTFEDIDWSKTKAYSFGYYGSIYINTKDHSNYGIVDNIAEYNKIRSNIIRDLKKLKDPETDKYIADRIEIKENIYKGFYVKSLPDIVFSMGNYSYASSTMFGFASNKIFSSPITPKSGEHRLNGILLMRGENIPKNQKVKNSNIIDIAPTVLSLFGENIPHDMDGKLIKFN